MVHDALRELGDLDVYERAYLCGGPRQVAIAALVALHEDGHVKIKPALARVRVVGHTARHPVETGVVALIPETGMRLSEAITMIAESTATAAVRRTLRARGLIGLTGINRRGRRLRLLLREQAADQNGALRVAVDGIPGIGDEKLRSIFETPDDRPPTSPPGPRRRRRLVGHFSGGAGYVPLGGGSSDHHSSEGFGGGDFWGGGDGGGGGGGS